MRHRPAFPDHTAQLRFDRRDLALYWGYVQGADLAALHSNYFAGEAVADLRQVKARVRAIAQELAAAARRTERPEIGALFLRDPGAMTGDVGGNAPTLDEFRLQADPDGFYSERELQELWSEQYSGGSGGQEVRSAEQRRTRLRARIREAIAWIETQVFPAPEPGHRLQAWLPLSYAQRLEAANLATVAQLVARINQQGSAWHRGVRGIGAEKARAIEQWVARHERPDRLQLLPSARLTPLQRAKAGLEQARASAIAPLERLEWPAALGPADGLATNDLAAVKAWIATKASPHTQRAYTREAERLLLWCLVVLGKPLAALTAADCGRYRLFLRAPGPAWLAPRGTPRWSHAWRPFEAGLSPAGERQALVILKAMAAWLQARQHLGTNPWAALNTAAGTRPAVDPRRAFTPAQWHTVSTALHRLDDTGARPRLKLSLWLLYGTGLRSSEAVACRVEHLQATPGPDGATRWSLNVPGPRGKTRQLPLAAELVERLQASFQRRGFASLADAPPQAFLLPRTDGGDSSDTGPEAHAGIAPGTLYRQIKAFFKQVAQEGQRAQDAGATPPAEADAAQRLDSASTHWLRHTFGMRLVSLTQDVALARDLLGHASAATTAAYLETGERLRHRAVEALMGVARPDVQAAIQAGG